MADLYLRHVAAAARVLARVPLLFTGCIFVKGARGFEGVLFDVLTPRLNLEAVPAELGVDAIMLLSQRVDKDLFPSSN